MNLKLFSEETTDKTEGEQEETRNYTKEEVDSLLQSESDKRVNQALENFKKNELPKIINDAKSEAEKLAQMTAEEKNENKRKEREKELKEKEDELSKRELRLEANKIISEKGLPIELLEVLNYTGGDECSKSIETVEFAFRNAVEQGINERLKGSPPKASTGSNNGINPFSKNHINLTKQAEIMKKDPEEGTRLRDMAEGR